MRLTVLGSSGSYPGRDRACAGYLVSHDGFRLLLDVGNGSLSNLQRVCDVADVDALVISHLHADHFADLYGLYYARRFHRDGARPLPVHAPAGAQAFIGQLLGGDDLFAEVCRFSEQRAGDALQLGPFAVSLHPSRHPVECLAARVAADGRVLTYTGDSGPAAGLTDAARDADLLVCDATWLEAQRPLPEGIHMTGLEAGKLAAESGARRLLVTHVFPTNDSAAVAAEAAQAFDGEVLAAHDGQELEV